MRSFASLRMTRVKGFRMTPGQGFILERVLILSFESPQDAANLADNRIPRHLFTAPYVHR